MPNFRRYTEAAFLKHLAAFRKTCPSGSPKEVATFAESFFARYRDQQAATSKLRFFVQAATYFLQHRHEFEPYCSAPHHLLPRHFAIAAHQYYKTSSDEELHCEPGFEYFVGLAYEAKAKDEESCF